MHEALVAFLAVLAAGVPPGLLAVPLLPLLGMAAQRQQNQQNEWGIRETTNLFYTLADALSTAVTPFTRHSFGKEALAKAGPLALVLMLAVGGFGGSPGMFVYLGLWVVALACQRLHTAGLARRGILLHSRDDGTTRRFFFARTAAGALNAEVVVCSCVGGGLIYFGEQVVGVFVLVAAFALIVRHSMDAAISARRVQNLRDAQIEQNWLAEQFRRQGGGRY